MKKARELYVLNLVINGWPSIPPNTYDEDYFREMGFKPCYKWMTFNTCGNSISISVLLVPFMF